MSESTQSLLAQAAEARRRGDAEAAGRLLEQVISADPANAPAHNSLGLLALGSGDPAGAARHLARAAELDAGAPPIWLNLAEAYRVLGQSADELAALDRALAIEPYLVPALFMKGQALERLGRGDAAVQPFRAMLSIVGDRADLPPAIQQPIAYARHAVAAANAARAERVSESFEEVRARYPGGDFDRARGYADHLAGGRKVYHQEPTAGHFPYLPALEYFPRALTPWFERLEAATDAIRAELTGLWSGDDVPGSRPYVRFDPSQPVNQWAELNHSPKWSAYFLWEDGRPVSDHLARCPATSQALATAPLLDIPGKSPTAMFSILKPRTRIPPHTGSSNVRSTVHLPLVVPDGCGFRVGAISREWRVGEAWAFDDTIEHEAWNDSDQPRAILILDIWNPLLTEAERAAVRVLG